MELMMGRLVRMKVTTTVRPTCGKQHQEAKYHYRQTLAKCNQFKDERKRVVSRAIFLGNGVLIEKYQIYLSICGL